MPEDLTTHTYTLEPDHLSEKLRRAYNLHQAGRREEAKQQYQQILLEDPANADALHLLGVLAFQTGQDEVAITLIKRSIVAAPRNVHAYNNLGLALEKQGLLAEAIDIYRRSIHLNSNQVGILVNLGNAWQRQGQLAEAIDAYLYAITLQPNNAQIHNDLADALQKYGSLDEAIYHYRLAIRLESGYAEAYNNLGLALQRKGLQKEAIEVFQRAIEHRPEIAVTYYNLSGALLIQGHATEAVETYRRGITTNPNHAILRYHYGMALLLTGDFKSGWTEYEERLKLNAFRRKDTIPHWDRSPLKGRTILLYAEQGIGDAIQFVRFIPNIVELEAEVVIECQTELKPLLKQHRTAFGVNAIIDPEASVDEDIRSKCDFCLPLMSLTYILRVYDEDLLATRVPYLRAMGTGSVQIPDTRNLRVGIVWAGNPNHVNDQFRSIRLESFSALFKLPDCDFYSLQVDQPAEELAQIQSKIEIVDLGQHLRNFADTAAIIDQLDLVISVDTSVAHLAGAMGKQIWTLVPAKPDWRWQLKRTDSPWYPTMRLFRQIKLGQWSDVITEVKSELSLLTQTYQRGTQS